MFYPSVTVKSTTRSLPMSTGHKSSFIVYPVELVFVKEFSAENHNKNSVSTQRNPHYGLCREHNGVMRAFSHCNKLIWMWGTVSGSCIFHKPKDSRWVNPPTRSEMKHFLINPKIFKLHIISRILCLQHTSCTYIYSMVIISVQVLICEEVCPRVNMKPGWHLSQVMTSISSIYFQDSAYLFPEWWLSWQMYLPRMTSNYGTAICNGLRAFEPGKQV